MFPENAPGPSLSASQPLRSGAPPTASSAQPPAAAQPLPARQIRRRWDPTHDLGRPQGDSRHGRERVQVELHSVDISGSEGDRPQGVLQKIQEGDALGLGQCRYNGRTCPRTWDDKRNDHHGNAGHRATDWRRICDFLGGGSLPARCTLHVKAGRADPVELQSGVGDDRKRNDSEQGDQSRTGRLPRRHRRPCCQTEQRRVRGPLHRRQLAHHIFVNKNFKVIGAD